MDRAGEGKLNVEMMWICLIKQSLALPQTAIVMTTL